LSAAMGGEISELSMQGLNIDVHGHSLAEIL
jgi:NitT/TauT family transport system ATP-binding protein